jgi:hypothetical protein
MVAGHKPVTLDRRELQLLLSHVWFSLLRLPLTSLLPTSWPNLELVAQTCEWYRLSNPAMRVQG